MPNNENFDLEVVYLPVDSLTPYENNARKHTPDDIEAIKQSILHLGFLDPVGVWGKDNIIVEGHGRQIAALQRNEYHAQEKQGKTEAARRGSDRGGHRRDDGRRNPR